jgi:integrase
MRPTSIRDIIDHRLLEVGHREDCPARRMRDRHGFEFGCECPGVERFRAHDAGRTYIGENLDAGTDIAMVANLVGHADIRGSTSPSVGSGLAVLRCGESAT